MHTMAVFISFDVDKTLADYSKAHGYSFLEGIPSVYKDFYVNWIDLKANGPTDMQIITELLHSHGMSYERIFKGMDDCVVRMTELFKLNIAKHPVVLIDGVREALASLDSMDVLMGLATGNLEEIAWLKMKNAGIKQYFKVGGFGTDAFTRTGVIRTAVRRAEESLGITPEDQLFHVGDTVNDVMSALEAGVVPIGVTTGFTSKEEFKEAGATLVIDNLVEIVDVVEKEMEGRN